MRRSREQSKAIFKRLGVDRVRANLAIDVYLGEEKEYAQAWLVEQEAATEEESLPVARAVPNVSRSSGSRASRC
jgi:hypothetical protein